MQSVNMHQDVDYCCLGQENSRLDRKQDSREDSMQTMISAKQKTNPEASSSIPLWHKRIRDGNEASICANKGP